MDRNEVVPSPRRNPPAQFNLSSLPVTPTVPEVSLLLDANCYRPARGPAAQGQHGQDAVSSPAQPFRGPTMPEEPVVQSDHSKAASSYCSVQHSPLVTSPATQEDAHRHHGPVQMDYAANLMLNVEKRLLEQRVKELEEENRSLRERVERLESQQDSLQQVKMDALAEQTAACLRLLENLSARKVQFERSTQTEDSGQPRNEFYDDALRAMQGLFPPAAEPQQQPVAFDTCYVPRVLPVASRDACSPRVSDVSAHMNQLALKHLSSSPAPVDKPQQPCMTYYNNLSMSTKQFLEKLKATPGQQARIAEEEHESTPSASRKGSTTDKVLDITAIKRQNKLL